MRQRSPAPEIQFLLALLDEAFEKRSWHGPNLKGSLRGVSAAAAAWRPAPGRHSIWELAVHAAYWKYAVRRRLTGGKRGSFPRRGSNWFERSEKDEAAWKRDLALLNEQHSELRRAVAAYSVAPGSPQWTKAMSLIRGIAAHDLYHAGQVQLLKRLCPLM